MTRCLFLLSLFIPLSVQAEIYRWVDAEGRVHFSDQRIPSAERLDIQSGRQIQPPPAPGPNSPDEHYPGPYSQVALLTPTSDQTLSDPAQGVAVSLYLEPALVEGHQLRLMIDNRVMVLDRNQTQLRLKGLEAGRHRLQIQVWGPDDRIVAQSASRIFELKLPSAPGELP
ncbi:DUF4124 domain-containing protein [Caldichromatium japonicum]|uniref:DUF4124 domain-containing protein n=1 Tax=Caldichromatium japonicum TaxID=2699430 RepID=A0A6G7VG43_9GAMM|nr:DUF4124 domain-containing protein [Caldichromatium japonicum]QIK38991.1 DUF4124 domain-containing protein [Caldichromatium japonicum]